MATKLIVAVASVSFNIFAYKSDTRIHEYLTMYILLLSCGPRHFQNLTPKCKVLNVFWNQRVSKEKNERFDFFYWLSNLKNLVFSNGSKNVQNVIQVGSKQLLFPKISKHRPAPPAKPNRFCFQTTSVIRVSYTSLLTTFPNLNIFGKLFRNF